jgi:hypothetical protein
VAASASLEMSILEFRSLVLKSVESGFRPDGRKPVIYFLAEPRLCPETRFGEVVEGCVVNRSNRADWLVGVQEASPFR